MKNLINRYKKNILKTEKEEILFPGDIVEIACPGDCEKLVVNFKVKKHKKTPVDNYIVK